MRGSQIMVAKKQNKAKKKKELPLEFTISNRKMHIGTKMENQPES